MTTWDRQFGGPWESLSIAHYEPLTPPMQHCPHCGEVTLVGAELKGTLDGQRLDSEGWHTVVGTLLIVGKEIWHRRCYDTFHVPAHWMAL